VRNLGTFIAWSGGPSPDAGEALESSEAPGLADLLREHDGLVAFDGGLRCFGLSATRLPSIAIWNRAEGWRAAYRDLTTGLLFFAEDVFGNQFAFEDGRIVRFLAETADREFVADTLDEWLAAVESDPDGQLSLWLMRDWRSQSDGPAFDEHLCPKIPFALGGGYETSNLYCLDRDKSMVFKGDLAWQTRHVPDGAKVRLKTDE
jgi:hypothetical protein